MFENENDANGMNNILHKLHKYVSFTGEEQHREYSSQPIIGDQLTVERAVNDHMSLQNGFTPEERLEGLYFEIADWHAGNKALSVSWNENHYFTFWDCRLELCEKFQVFVFFN